MDLIMTPVRIATSKPARKTYLNTFLFAIASSILLCFAAVAYVLFYYNYVPQIGIERPIHLQYGAGPHPYGITSLSSSLIAQQPYDITLTVHVPRSPPNLNRGNFMLSLSLLPSTYTPNLPSTQESSHTLLQPPSPLVTLSPDEVLFSSRRPCILTYTSRLVSLSSRILYLPLYLLGLRSESEVLSIPMAESVVFKRGWKNIPAYALLELQAGQDVQVYDVRLHFKARFEGLRWMMYNHRIISFVVFTSMFWFSEIIFTALTWGVLSTILHGKEETPVIKEEEREGKAIEEEGEERATDEEPDLSDTPRTFPTYGRQPPLRFVPPKVKEEEEVDSEDYLVDEKDIKQEADDEDDGEGIEARTGGKTDSGVGTSFSEAGERSGLARRRSKSGRTSSP